MLEKYKKKRNFSRTKEPSGSNRKPRKELVFMVHKHHASHLHYDLRLELDGVLKSWAVPKGPSLDPEIKRLAIMVEDHPFEYKDFEGVIPEGEYGAGPSMIWDYGTYTPGDDQRNKKGNQKLIREKLEKGHVSFVLHGEKLRGEFSLVHMPDDKKGNSWLLIKTPDEYANVDIKNADRSVRSGKTIEELKDGGKPEEISLTVGVKGELPRNVRPMLATLVDAPFDKKDWIFEIKWDGYRTIAQVEDGKVSLYSRNGLSFDAYFPEIAEEMKGYPDAVFDGEIVAFDENMKSDFELLQNYLKEKKGMIGYYVFDIIYYNGRELSGLGLLERKSILKRVLRESPFVRYTDHIEERGIDFFDASKKLQLEGIIGKDTKSTYRFGERGTSWVKIKNALTTEAIICGYTEPRGSRKGLGALILGMYENGKLRYIGHTGGGFDARSLLEIRGMLDGYKTEKCPFEIIPKTNERATWIEPNFVCEVKFREWTKDGILRQPIFLGLREDKNPEEVTKEKEIRSDVLVNNSSADSVEPMENETTQSDLSAGKSQERSKKISISRENSASGRSLQFSNIDKIYFPEDNLTKGDIIEYYKKIAPYMLPYLLDRPETLVRYPNGIHSKGFYQKNLKKEEAPSWICTEEIPSGSENRMVNYAVVCKDAESLLYLINLGCIDLHPWASRVGSLEYPDYIIFDFDPEDIPFVEVVKAVQITHEILEEIGALCYCKTSGATGIHILVPTGSKYTFEQTTSFAKLINTVVHSRLPDTTSMERSPKKRQKRVYLDYLQNRHGQTIASVYSIRPRVGAPVSTPILWEELDEKLDPQSFNIHTIFKRLDSMGDLWKGMFKKKFDMEKSIKKLQNILI